MVKALVLPDRLLAAVMMSLQMDPTKQICEEKECA